MRRWKITTEHGDVHHYDATDMRTALQAHHIRYATDVIKAKEIK